MPKIRSIGVILLWIVSSSCFAQKIKYKDVFGLLSTRQYEAAEPFLKKYLSENDDNPNAFLYMGIIYQEKSMKDDILKKTQESLDHMDSAIYFFNKAYKTIDERELKRNKDYYAMYFRRDLRSGEYGVKLSDVQFELEKSIASLKERIDKVKMVKHYFDQAVTLYKKSNDLYVSIQSAFPGQRELYLRANEKTLKDLTALSVRFDSCSKAFEHYKVSIGNISKSGYNQSWNITEIENFKTDGAMIADFFEPNLQVWDYKSFATDVVTVVEKELIPIREKLVRYDIELSKLRDRITNDSISVKSDLTKLVDNLLSEKLEKFDKDPLPLNVLALKVAKLEYQSTLVEHKKKKDSLDVFYKVSQVQDQLKALNRLDSIATRLANKNIDEEVQNYTHFVTSTYSTLGLLKNYVKTEKDYALREKRNKTSELSLRTKALHWLVTDKDSIPLELTYSKSKYKPLFVEEKKYTAGIVRVDSAKSNGYFFTITPSRRPDIKVTFPFDEVNINCENLSSLRAQVTADEGSNIHFVLLYSTVPVNDKIPVTLAKIYRSDGLSWSKNFMLSFKPTGIEYLQDSTDLVIKSETELVTFIDKSGSVRQ